MLPSTVPIGRISGLRRAVDERARSIARMAAMPDAPSLAARSAPIASAAGTAWAAVRSSGMVKA